LNAALSVAPEATGTVTISSDPDGAEIFVDDKFYGSTPATLDFPLEVTRSFLNFRDTPTGAAPSKSSNQARHPSRLLSTQLHESRSLPAE
jgi:hypothetical protein